MMERDDDTDPGQGQLEVFEQSDEALDDATSLDPLFLEDLELDPDLDPAQQIDERELEEIGAQLDDPLALNRTRSSIEEQERGDGWELDAPLTEPEPLQHEVPVSLEDA